MRNKAFLISGPSVIDVILSLVEAEILGVMADATMALVSVDISLVMSDE